MMAIGQTTLFSMPILQSVYENKAKEVLLYISTISIVFRIFVFLTQNTFPVLRIDRTFPVLYSTVKVISSLVSPLCMLLIGMSIGEAKIIECIKDKNAWCLAVLRNIFAPVLISVLCLILHAVQKRRGDGKPCMRYFYNFDFNNFSAKFRY